MLTPVPGQIIIPGQPIQFEVKSGNHAYSSSLPLGIVLNARSVYNKIDSLKQMLTEIGAELNNISETWERKRVNLEKLLESTHFKTMSYLVGAVQLFTMMQDSKFRNFK